MELAPRSGYRDWQTLYRAAILEKNQSVIPWKVLQAERAVLARDRELLSSEGTPEEKEALEDALYTLRAFRSAHEHLEAA